MTEDKARLLELAERCEKAEGPDRRLDGEIGALIQRTRVQRKGHSSDRICPDVTRPGFVLDGVGGWVAPEYTRSLDAAMTLVPEGWFWRVGRSTLYAGWASLNAKHPDHCNPEDEVFAKGASPVLALCAAALRARAQPSQGDQ